MQLEPGWAFVDTEDWEPDYLAKWSRNGADQGTPYLLTALRAEYLMIFIHRLDGWVYTNDAWLDPQPHPVEEMMKAGMTRRRRWTRRICPVVPKSTAK